MMLCLATPGAHTSRRPRLHQTSLASRPRQASRWLAVLLCLVGLIACAPNPPPASPGANRGAQKPAGRVARVGFLSSIGADSPLAVDGYQQLLVGLRELGYEIGQDLIMEYRSAEGDATRYPELVADLVRLPVDVIVIGDSRAQLPALAATSSIPIVTAIGDIRAVGLVDSLARPTGNLTGLSNLIAGLNGKRLELLKAVVPSARRIAVIRNPSDPGMLSYWEEAGRAAQSLGVELLPFDVQQPASLPEVFSTIAAARPDALIVLPDPLTNVQNRAIVEFAATERLPAIYGWRAFVDNGGLMHLAFNRRAAYHRTATFVHRILEGAKPADLPIEQPTRFDLVINRRTAQALGLSFPESVVVQATEAID